MTDLFPRHGGFRQLRSFQVAQQVYDGTTVFCNKFIDRRSRTHDQMVQAARSGVQNIAEGSLASATSKKTELNLKKAVESVCRGCAVILSAAVVTTASSKSQCRHGAMSDPEG